MDGETGNGVPKLPHQCILSKLRSKFSMADKIFLTVDEFYAIITALHGLKCQFSELAYLNPTSFKQGNINVLPRW